MAIRNKSNGIKTGRRSFLRAVSLGAGALALPNVSAKEGEEQTTRLEQTAGKAPVRRTIKYPRIFTGRELAMISFPLGGIGAGSIGLGGRGQLRDWEIFNRPDKGGTPQYAFPSIWAQVGKRKPVARILEAKIMPPYEGSLGLGFANVPGLPRLESCTFIGEFPLARIEFHDSELPVQVTLEAFTPFIPLAADDSGLPLAVLRYHVSNRNATKAKVAIAFSLENPVAVEGRTNEYRESGDLHGLLMQNPFLAAADPLAGTFALSVLARGENKLTYLRGWPSVKWWQGPLMFWDDFTADGELGPEGAVRGVTGSLCLQRELGPRNEAEYTFLVSWHFPNRTPERCGWKAPKGHERDVIGNHYCTQFHDAWAVAEHAATRLPELEARTRKFVEAMRQSTLPDAVRDAAMSNLSTLVTPTTFRTTDGVFHGFEGCSEHTGCCFGSCTHVWNYEMVTDHLFPTLARSFREQQFGFSTDAEGRMDFRELLPGGIEHFGIAAADGQMGTIIKLYLDWRLSGDTAWLRRLWPAAKRALEFAWIPGGWDANRDGVMEGVQHNTYDVEFYGPNPLCGIYYLGALRAGEEMARVVGDTQAADEYRRVFESGRQWLDANLFNGEYYIQKVHAIPADKIAKGLRAGMGSINPDDPDFQLGDGCLVDQLVGQYVALVAELGLLLDPHHIHKTLQSIYKYNYKRTLDHHESVQRVFALNNEAGLVICDYSQGKRPMVPFPYFAELMTGFEYSAAILMLYMGMVSQGVEVIENIRRRYDGERRNPWDEAECGYHYARAMASWAAVLALSGFRYHGGERKVVLTPRINREQFSCFWSTATGWGTFSQTIHRGETKVSLAVAHGELPCRSMTFTGKAGANVTSSATLGTTSLPHELRRIGTEATFVFAKEVVLKEPEQLTLAISKKSVPA
jgi:non-lysosomal glucosylceramidase